jgi:cell division protein FtsA
MRYVMGDYLAAIDIGTTKICVLIAAINSKGKLDIVGIGQHPSNGLKKGVVVNIAMTVESIKAAVKEAETMAGIPIESAAVGISGGHIKSYNSTGVVAIKGRDVSQGDIDRVIEAAKAIAIPQDQEILHVLPQYFKVDGQEYVLYSLGMYGVRLEAQVHIITGAVASAQNIVKSCELAGVKVSDIVLEQIASADAVLTDSERELGVGIIDIGGGTSDFALYKDGRIRHSKVLAIAGSHFTQDLAIGLGISRSAAEAVKKMHGTAEDFYGSDERVIEVSLDYEGGIKKVPLALVSDIVRSRALEILELFNDEFNEYRLKAFMASGVVLTGGGSLLAGMRQLSEEMFSMPVRIGYPLAHLHADNSMPDVLKSPIYSTAYGLLLYSLHGRYQEAAKSADAPLINRVFGRMKSWIYDFL